jgi:hypothetical protein
MPPFDFSLGPNEMMNMNGHPMSNEADRLDVTISIGFLRGVFMHENKKVRDWQQHDTELDAVKVVVLARNEANQIQAKDFLTSAPLTKPKPVGEWMNYTALFPLKGSSTITKMTLPGLIQRDPSSDSFASHGSYKRESVDLLITLVFGNEAITIGKSRVVITGEELRTKQSDLPVEINRDAILRAQKKSYFPMRRMTSLHVGKGGDLSPMPFKFDRRRRKFQMETDAVLRVFFKVSPHDPYNNSNMSVSIPGNIFSKSMNRKRLFGNGSIRSRSRSNSVGPRNREVVPSTIGGGFTELGSPSRFEDTNPNIGQGFSNPSLGRQPSNYGRSNNDFGSSRQMQQQSSMDMHNSMPAMHSVRNMVRRTPSNARPFDGQSPDRAGPPGGTFAFGSRNQSSPRSQSAPRMRYSTGGGMGDQQRAYGGSAFGGGGGFNGGGGSGASNLYGGSSFGGSTVGMTGVSRIGGVGSKGRGQNPYGDGQQAYGGSSYGGVPRKYNINQGMGQYGGQYSRGRSQSPYITRI